LTYQLLGWRRDADGTTAVDPNRDGDGMVGQPVEAAIPTGDQAAVAGEVDGEAEFVHRRS
jgi:hypothetical protein